MIVSESLKSLCNTSLSTQIYVIYWFSILKNVKQNFSFGFALFFLQLHSLLRHTHLEMTSVARIIFVKPARFSKKSPIFPATLITPKPANHYIRYEFSWNPPDWQQLAHSGNTGSDRWNELENLRQFKFLKVQIYEKIN